MKKNYIEIVNQAMNYIYINIDNNLTTEKIAEQCCFSQYHFNRIFKLVTGENIYSFIKRMKLERAAFKLKTQKYMTITDIALEAGYSPSNFASAFKNHFGLCPTEFAQTNTMPFKNDFKCILNHIEALKKDTMIFQRINDKMKIKPLSDMSLIYKRVICHYTRDLKQEWEIFCTELQEKNLISPSCQFIGISYDDPLIIDEERCVYDMCLKVPTTSGINIHKFKGGLYASFPFYDTLDQLIFFVNEIFSLWLPYCPYELDDKPSLEIYNSDIDKYGKISIDFCLPIKDEPK